MANVLVENTTLQSIADSIRNKTGKTEAMLPSEMPAEIEGIETSSSVIDFARYCRNIEIWDLNLLGEEDITLNLDNVTDLGQFYYVPAAGTRPPINTTVKHLTINCLKKVTNLREAFCRLYVGDNTLEHLTLNIDTSEVTNAYYSIVSCNALKVIDGQPLNLSKATNVTGTIRNLYSLEEIRFVENSIPKSFDMGESPKLSGLSIQSVIDGLADLTGRTEQKITWHTNIILKLTDEQAAQIRAKNWTIG